MRVTFAFKTNVKLKKVKFIWLALFANLCKRACDYNCWGWSISEKSSFWIIQSWL